MPFFEEQPLLLVPVVLAIVIVYDIAKSLVRALLRRRQDEDLRPNN